MVPAPPPFAPVTRDGDLKKKNPPCGKKKKKKWQILPLFSCSLSLCGRHIHADSIMAADLLIRAFASEGRNLFFLPTQVRSAHALWIPLQRQHDTSVLFLVLEPQS